MGLDEEVIEDGGLELAEEVTEDAGLELGEELTEDEALLLTGLVELAGDDLLKSDGGLFFVDL